MAAKTTKKKGVTAKKVVKKTEKGKTKLNVTKGKNVCEFC